MSERFSGKVAIITGGATGIGRAVARRLAREGARTVVLDIDAEGANRAAGEISGIGSPSIGLGCDVSEEGEVARAVATVVDHFGRVDVLHNNAAATGPDVYGRDLDVVRMTVDVWDKTLAVNLRSAMLLCKHTIPIMLQGGGGSIVNMSSTTALAGDVSRTAYAASKAALISLTQDIAATYGPDGVRCNALAPGLIMSERHQANPSPLLAHVIANQLTPHEGTTDDIAGLIAYLASDEGAFITGQVLTVDGGLLSHMPMYESFKKAMGASDA